MDAFRVYSLFDIQIVRGNGCYVFDNNGNRYLDLYGILAVIQIGHSHPHYIEKITEQLKRLAFYSNFVINGIQQEFIKKLEKQCGYPDYSVFLINSGAEAVENSLKLASFHTGRKKVPAFRRAFRGKFFAHQYSEIKANIIAVAKGIANGLPMAAILIHPMFQAVKGRLGTTFGGNHLVCAAASAILDVLEDENLIENAGTVGAYLMQQLSEFSEIKEVRGRGLMIGLEFDFPVNELREKLLYEHRIFTGISGSNIIRFLPPLSLTIGQAEQFVHTLKDLQKQKR